MAEEQKKIIKLFIYSKVLAATHCVIPGRAVGGKNFDCLEAQF